MMTNSRSPALGGVHVKWLGFNSDGLSMSNLDSFGKEVNPIREP